MSTAELRRKYRQELKAESVAPPAFAKPRVPWGPCVNGCLDIAPFIHNGQRYCCTCWQARR